jgi:hypothetical protein
MGYGGVNGAKAADVGFIPKVWSDHISAYFDRKMALGQLALMDRTLTAAPGETVTFPYYKAIGAAEEPGEDTALAVDKLVDDAFSVTVKEVGKAVAWTDKNKRKSAQVNPEGEAQGQIARVFAEKVDADIITEINTAGKYSAGYVAADAAGVCKVHNLLEGKILGFGDKHEAAIAVAMHSLCFLDMMKDSTVGFLKADATQPMYGIPGYQGLMLGMAVFTLDSMPELAPIDGTKAFATFCFKANPFGIYMAEDLKPEMDRDILYRQNIVSATMWYGVLSLHGKMASQDKRIIRNVFATSQAAV